MITQLNTSSAALNLKALMPQQRQGHVAATATSADSATISQAAHDLLSASVSAVQSGSAFSKMVSRSAHEDPVQAERLAYGYSHSRQVPWLDFSEHTEGTGPIRYAATGQPVTEESEAYFNSVSSAVLQHGTDLYNTEKAKGTPAADILDQLFGYFDALPERYNQMTSWGRRV